MKIYNYSVSTNTIWTSFDFGEVEAENIEDAKKKALDKLKYDFKKANDALSNCDIIKDFNINFDETQIEINENINN